MSVQSEPSRLDRIEAALDRFILATERERIASNERHDQLSAELQALSRDVSRLVDTIAEAARERHELREATLGIANLLASLDSDRPTILRKLNAIENKVDRLLDNES
jgi:chromosome segregation ATPase